MAYATKAIALDPAQPLVLTLGEPEYNRRLSDKILAAFNHAYASGEEGVAGRLKELLATLEEQAARKYPQRRGHSALVDAERWMAFVEARNRYREICESADAEPAALAQALNVMKIAYKLWSNA
jgi:hypothetical protein